MNYFKSVMAGFTASIIAGIVFLVAAFAYYAEWSSRYSSDSFAGGGYVSVESQLVTGTPLLVVLIVSFAAGFIWMVKRTTRQAFQ